MESSDLLEGEDEPSTPKEQLEAPEAELGLQGRARTPGEGQPLGGGRGPVPAGCQNGKELQETHPFLC